MLFVAHKTTRCVDCCYLCRLLRDRDWTPNPLYYFTLFDMFCVRAKISKPMNCWWSTLDMEYSMFVATAKKFWLPGCETMFGSLYVSEKIENARNRHEMRIVLTTHMLATNIWWITAEFNKFSTGNNLFWSWKVEKFHINHSFRFLIQF